MPTPGGRAALALNWAALAPIGAAMALSWATVALIWAIVALIGAKATLIGANIALIGADAAPIWAMVALIWAGAAPNGAKVALTWATAALTRANAALLSGEGHERTGESRGEAETIREARGASQDSERESPSGTGETGAVSGAAPRVPVAGGNAVGGSAGAGIAIPTPSGIARERRRTGRMLNRTSPSLRWPG